MGDNISPVQPSGAEEEAETPVLPVNNPKFGAYPKKTPHQKPARFEAAHPTEVFSGGGGGEVWGFKRS